MKKVKLELFSTLFDQHTIPDFYSSISYFKNQKIFNDTTNHYNEQKSSKNLYSLRLVPGYMNFNLKNEELLNIKKIPQINWGYAIFLDSTSGIEDFINSQFKTKFRTNIKRSINRLETCFEITYRMYHGDIDRETYIQLMESLRIMLINRFSEKNVVNNNLPKWKELCANTFSLIAQKKASLFVIYNGDRPIAISLNYHLDKILFSSISSYDLDYSKFGISHVEIYRQLEWCFLNNYLVFEMGVGSLDYKRRWSNHIYNYEHHVYYNKSFLSNCYAFFEISRVKLKEYLKSKQIPEYISKGKAAINFEKKVHQDVLHNFEIESTIDISLLKNSEKINFQNDKYHYLRRPIYDFLYSTLDHVSKIQVFEIIKDTTYIISGKSANQKVTFYKNTK
ncbi:GNAT family N-acetyltransferase [Arenibacter palladensis]|uniref:GNAT family N-acetyltransferase n=1 Tax=Arenibacter palladensis TaxID=237373 RepID=UPI002FCED55F